jgi:hypothetical protein
LTGQNAKPYNAILLRLKFTFGVTPMQLQKTPGYKIIAAWLRAQGFQPFPFPGRKLAAYY